MTAELEIGFGIARAPRRHLNLCSAEVRGELQGVGPAAGRVRGRPLQHCERVKRLRIRGSWQDVTVGCHVMYVQMLGPMLRRSVWRIVAMAPNSDSSY